MCGSVPKSFCPTAYKASVALVLELNLTPPHFGTEHGAAIAEPLQDQVPEAALGAQVHVGSLLKVKIGNHDAKQASLSVTDPSL